MKESFRCLLQTISPVHIGCDEVYEPMGFVLDQEAQRLIVFNPLSFFARMDEKDKQGFSQICSKGTISSILEIYKFLEGRKAKGKSIDVCQGFVEHYHKTLSIPLHDTRKIQQELNNFTIARTSFSPSDHRPYIPGSAIKGALRTAYLNTLAKEKKVPSYQGKGAAKKLEKTLLNGGEFSTDPFRMVKVSDFKPVEECKTRVLYAINEKKFPTGFVARGPYQILEVVEAKSMFEGWITVEEPLQKAGIKSPISLENLLKGTAWFYIKERTRENEELNRIGISKLTMPNNQNTFLIRLGRHSGAESVTIEGQRSIKIMTGRGQKDKYANHATTLWLASEVPRSESKENLRPFGWAILSQLTAAKAQEIEEKENAWHDLVEAQRRGQLAEEEIERQKQIEHKRKLEEEAKRQALDEELKREEEEKRKTELQAMSPEERDIAVLHDPSTNETQVVQIYTKIDEFSQENKRLLAQALKDYWVANEKWKKKDCSNKQWKKVQKVKAILGEQRM